MKSEVKLDNKDWTDVKDMAMSRVKASIIDFKIWSKILSYANEELIPLKKDE